MSKTAYPYFEKTINATIATKKDSDEDGEFSGYASTFGNVDSYGDVMVMGCFAKSLNTRGVKFPILDSHKSDKQIGFNLEAVEDDKGLFVRGKLNLKGSETAREKYSLMKMAEEVGTTTKLSIGFRLKDYEYSKEGKCLIKEVDLLEYSIVAMPANDQASVVSVKSYFEENEKKNLQLKEISEMLKAIKNLNKSWR